MAATPEKEVIVRLARPEDSAVCGRICYDAFAKINAEHGFPCDFPGPEAATGLLTMMFSTPGFYAVVAESEGEIVGSNILAEHSAIGGVGPVSIDPRAQNLKVGRRLMHAVMDRATERGMAGTRLVQAAFHNRSFALYASLGFEVREQLACLQGQLRLPPVPGCTVRPAEPGDMAACREISLLVHGFDRSVELPGGIEQGTARVVERDGRVTGYTTHLAFFGHSAAETNVDMQALIASAESFGGPGILVPSRNSVLLRWCLGNGLRVTQLMTLMSTGLYSEPQGAWLPSVLY